MSQVPGFDPKRRLGRGLSALLGGSAPASEEAQPHADPGELRHIPIDRLTRNPYQPRKEFDAESLGELSGSIREHGILQPLLVREVEGGFQVIAGERRWQASVRAGLASVPCRVVDVIDKTACEYALEENLKRKDLGDLEKAQAFRDYLTNFGGTIEELSKQLSMNRSTVSNFLRLLDLAEPVRLALSSGRISAGHARALLPLETAAQMELCGRIQSESLSVRQTESAVRKLLGRSEPAAAARAAEAANGEPGAGEGEAGPQTISLADAAAEQEQLRTNHIASLEEQLRQLLGAKVEIRLKKKDVGTVLIPFASNDEFENIVRQIRRAAA
ncbi:MAG: ParB/RepB/Spo0J family partition protein [Planctomyces sp.]|nr:ParB/RepB/Spo0J family partition protein [Planctomyces sp.]